MIFIGKIILPQAGLVELPHEARSEGCSFLDVLEDGWANGTNRFDGPGEALCGAFDHDRLGAIGGPNCDPFVPALSVGRIRRVYVRFSWRRRDIGKALVSTLVDQARGNFKTVRLSAENADAAHLCESMGFLSVDDPNATHILYF